jgi:hypothetical protein
VTRKVIFTMPFYLTCGAQPLCLGYYNVGYKVGGRSCATYIFLHDLPPSPRLHPYG